MRTKKKSHEIEKDIDKDVIRRLKYFFEDVNKVEFIKPERHNLNQFLFQDDPLTEIGAGPSGLRDKFYIDQIEIDQLKSLFEEFKIPEDIYQNLIWAYLNMVFASCTARHTDKTRRIHNENLLELYQTFDLVETLSLEKKFVCGYNLELKEKITKELTIHHVNGHVASNFMHEILKDYKASKFFQTFKSGYEYYKIHGNLTRFFNYKNTFKEKQSYYANVIFDYLRHKLFGPLFDYLSDEIKFNEHRKELMKKYSHNKIFLLIGRMMILSGLLNESKTESEKYLIDKIEKKLGNKFVYEKAELRRIIFSNANSKDGRLEIIPFHLYF